MSKFTHWFPGTVPPVHIGVYQIHPSGDRNDWYSFFDGKKWGWMGYTVEDALRSASEEPFKHLALAWRGLAVKP